MGDHTSSPDVSSEAGPPEGAGALQATQQALRAALERLVLLECRSQLVPGFSPASAELELSRWRAEAQRAEARAASAVAQRDRLFERLIHAERVHAGLSGEVADVDLASFIAELRAELSRLEQARDAAERQRAELLAQLLHRTPDSVSGASVDLEPESTPLTWARQLQAQGVLRGAGDSLQSLKRDLVAGTVAERALLQGALHDLSEGDAPLRRAAAIRLEGLPANLAAPVLAAALSRETEPTALAALVRAAGLTGVVSLSPLLLRLRSHPDAQVRAALVFAEVRLAPPQLAEHWFQDPAPRVRRRAALAVALHSPSQAEGALRALAVDADAGVRQAAAAGAATLSPAPVRLLTQLAHDGDRGVRRVALRSLSVPLSVADEPPAERRRLLFRRARAASESPAQAETEGLRASSVSAGPVAAAQGFPPAAPAVPLVDPGEPPFVPFDPGEPQASHAEPVVPRAPADLAATIEVTALLEAHLRSSLRGLNAEQLATAAGLALPVVSAALHAAPARFGTRNGKWFAQ